MIWNILRLYLRIIILRIKNLIYLQLIMSYKMKRFTNLYHLSKTLRFELVPDERSKHIIEQLGLIVQDEQRAESYIIMKIIIDRYHGLIA